MKKKIRMLLLIFFFLVFTASAGLLTRELVTRRLSANYLSALQTDYQPLIRKPEVLLASVVDAIRPEQEGNSMREPELTDLSNPEIRELVEQYPDAVGWLTLEGADISHPFAIGEDNGTYIRSALDGSYVRSGTLFLDFRNKRDMTDHLTVLFGHNMNDGTMFSNLNRYLEADYLADRGDVYVSLPDTTLHYRVWAAMIADAVSDPVFTQVGEPADMDGLLSYISSHAVALNSSVSVDSESRLLVLSTCNPSYFYARTVLICVED
ncbi:MAG: class B sortase [Oscillospiraceae bacterium]|nr:class B sortase [Oscillospiraceae bacterium]